MTKKPSPYESILSPERIAEAQAEQQLPEERPIIQADTRRLKILAQERAARRIEAWRMFRPINPSQRRVLGADESEILAIGSNRSGKTTVAAVNFTLAVLGQHRRTIAGLRGGTSQQKRIGLPETDGRAICVAKDWEHIGRVIWGKLGRAGAFSIMRDPKDGHWRAVDFASKRDRDKQELWKPAPPLIPPRMIESINWYNKAKRQPDYIRLLNGWELFFHSSEGDIPQGDQYDLVWFDEEITAPEWYPEVAVRGRVDRVGGFFQWSATPQAATDALWDLHERAIQPTATDIVEVKLHIDDNKSLSKAQRDAMYERLNPADRLVRYHGEFARLTLKVYPEFCPHVEDPTSPGLPGHLVAAFAIPPSWCRYVVFDPGVQRAAVLFAAIPPEEEGRGYEIHLYDELYIERGSASKIAHLMTQKQPGQVFQAFIMDHSAGRMSQLGAGDSVEYSYEQQFRERGVRSIMTGYGFLPGSRDTRGREEKFRRWLEYRADVGVPTLRVHEIRCPNFIWEMDRQVYKKRPNGLVTDQRVDRDNHLVTCAEYLAAAEPTYITPKRPDDYQDPILRRLAERSRQDGPGYVALGPAQTTKA